MQFLYSIWKMLHLTEYFYTGTAHGARDNYEVCLQVNVSLTVLNIQNIDETKGTFQLNIESSYDWIERRVLFHNLKQKSTLNTLLPEEVATLWLPEVSFSSTTQRGGKEVEPKISVSRQGAFARSGLDVADEIEIFDGVENKLSMKEARGEEFLCSFRTFWYPFDKQVGGITVITKS